MANRTLDLPCFAYLPPSCLYFAQCIHLQTYRNNIQLAGHWEGPESSDYKVPQLLQSQSCNKMYTHHNGLAFASSATDHNLAASNAAAEKATINVGFLSGPDIVNC